MKNKSEAIDIRKYLSHLAEEGWTELIDIRWKDEVKQTLLDRFPQMTEDEWECISEVVFC